MNPKGLTTVLENDDFDDVEETVDDYESDGTAWKAFAGYLVYDTEARVTTPLGTAVAEDSGDDFTWSAVDDANALWLTGAFRF